jgi:hypothetical protein
MARPRPVPPYGGWWSCRPARRRNSLGSTSGDADAGVLHLEAQQHAASAVLLLARTRRVTRCRLGELDRVGGVVEQRLLQPRRVAEQRAGRAWSVSRAAAALGLGLVAAWRRRCRPWRSTSTGASSSANLPASILDRSSTALMMLQQVLAGGFQLVERCQPAGRGQPGAAHQVAMPVMALSGVRISWLMLARKALLATLAASEPVRRAGSPATRRCSGWHR